MFLENLYHYREAVSLQVLFVTVFFVSRVMTILIFDDYTLMYDNYVIIETVFVRFDLRKVDNTYWRDFKRLAYIIWNYVSEKMYIECWIAKNNLIISEQKSIFTK